MPLLFVPKKRLHTIVLDNNVHRKLLSPKGAKARYHFARLRDLFADYISTKSRFAITPGGVLELLGLIPPAAPPIHLDSSVVSALGSKKNAHQHPELSYKIAQQIVEHARDFFRKSPILSHQSILDRIEQQRRFIAPEMKWLFEQEFPYEKMQTLPFERILHEHLAWDYFYKFDFPVSIKSPMRDFCLASLFFSNNFGQGGCGRFRLAKRMWDELHDIMIRKDPQRAARGRQMVQALKLKSHKDYLDCDIIHVSCFGIENESEELDSVACVTMDPLTQIEHRIWLYKFMLAVAEARMLPEMRANLPIRSEGIIIFCSTDGEFRKAWRVSDTVVPQLGQSKT